ncbi:cytochrome C [Corallococcus exercitus]|uniref:C-type cytochrome n=1 Tax=Corallococcus exercitus TaxID=2316736 RepID=A0A3A8IBP7_9BACT|nr:c-type cytochrome [Corallococcus exercitus]NOK36042.1 c-type cytochrome [Corallococcus exercitus]RKG80505.1 cytochrome C [Corallococcus exercitus]
MKPRILLGTLVLLTACEREQRRFQELPAAARPAARDVQVSELQPGPVAAPPSEPAPATRAASEDNAYDVSEGKRLYVWFNCAGCHAAGGGGGMGPPLLDAKWRYGSEPENIYATIVEGRPNGMPSFRGKIPDTQVWQLVAYVRSMSGLLKKDVAPGRSDTLNTRPSESSKARETPRPEEVEQPR